MTLVNAPGLVYPDPAAYGALVVNTTTFVNTLLDAAAEKFAFIFRVPKTGTVARVGFRTGPVTVGDTLKISFQDVDLATGDPDGVVDQFRAQVVADANDNTWFRTGLITSDGTDGGVKRSVTRNERLAVVIEFDSFVAGNLQIASGPGVVNGGAFMGQHYLRHFTAAWASISTSVVAAIAIEYDDGTFAYIPNTRPGDANQNLAVNTGTTPDEVGLKFRVPFPCRADGYWLSADFDGDADVVLYDSDGTTPLQTDTIDKDVRHLASGAAYAGHFPAAQVLLPNTFYRLAIKPSSVTSVTVPSFTVDATPGAAVLDQMSGGRDFHWSERTDAGGWTDTPTKRPVIGLILSGIEDGASVGASFRVVTPPPRRLRRRL